MPTDKDMLERARQFLIQINCGVADVNDLAAFALSERKRQAEEILTERFARQIEIAIANREDDENTFDAIYAAIRQRGETES